MDTGCEHYSHRLSLYLDDRLDDADCATLESHLAECSACSKALEQAKSLRSSLALRAAPQAPSFLQARIMAELAQRESQAAQTGWLAWLPSLRWMATASSAFAACVIALALWFPATHKPQPPRSSPSLQEQMLFGETPQSNAQIAQSLWDDDADNPSQKAKTR